jgi:selenocysteine lyase/cysteine desulfurase
MSSLQPDRQVAGLFSLDRAAAAFTLPPDVLYLNSAAQGPRLSRALAAGQAALAATISPWSSSLADWREQIEHLRMLAALALFGGDADGLAMIPSASYGLATAARNLPLRANEAVLVLEDQYPSNLLIWQQHCAQAGAGLVAVSRAPEQDWTQAVLLALDNTARVRIVALPQTHWHDGALLDLDRIADAVHARGAALVLDLSQSLGVLPVSLQRWQPDFIISVGHKWLLGPYGLAWLWAAPRWRSEGLAIEQHWQARELGEAWDSPVHVAAPHRSGARRFDAGGVSDPQRLAMATEAMSQLLHWGPGQVAARLQQRVTALSEGLREHGLQAWLPQAHAPHLLGLRPPAAQLPRLLQGLHQALVVFTHRLGRLRIAPHLHVDPVQMRALANLLASAARA